MRQRVGVLVALAMLLGAAPVWADAFSEQININHTRGNIKVAAVSSTTYDVTGITSDSVIVGYAFTATTAAAYVTLYDEDASTDITNADLIPGGEASEATQHDPVYRVLPEPYKIENGGLSVVLTNTTNVQIFYL